MKQTYSITELSREFDATPRTLRFYEDQGLLNPGRRGMTRVYSDRDRTRLKLALRGRRLGLTVEECKEIIDMYDPSRPRNARQLLRLCEKIREHRATLLEKFRDIEATLNAMDEVERRCLEELLAAPA
ncbi:MAG: MerR family transcriptional regulator [Gammaproteobacteria bacterium RIFCSPLOWO2_02_FULL_61_13]|nr:MAG: MerR family transcriptional regulator [Gammaproteobacteria bacterium RIFCSPLOWO2_02_FULL_61_13]